MSKPFVPTHLIEATRLRSILAIELREGSMRTTAPHAHEQGQLIGSLAGLLSVTAEDGSWVVPATHAVWIPPHFSHALRSHGPFEGWSVYVAEAVCVRLPAESRTLRVSALLREVVHRAASWRRPPETEIEHRLADVLLDEIGALPVEPLGLPCPSDVRLRRITDGMLADLADDRPLDAWANWAGVSSRTLARRFKTETGFGLAHWRQRARALRAIELLADGLPVTTIAIELGYGNVSAFIAMFRRTMGITPGRYVRSQTSYRIV